MEGITAPWKACLHVQGNGLQSNITSGALCQVHVTSHKCLAKLCAVLSWERNL